MWRFLYVRVRRPTLLLVGCLALLGGVGLAHSGYLLGASWCAGFLVLLALSLRKQSVWTLVFIVMFGCSFGWWRGSMYMNKLAQYQPLFMQKIDFQVQAMDDGVYGKNSQLVFEADHITLADGEQLAGKVQISGFGLGAVFQGDEVRVSGKLYPGLGAYQGFMSFAQLNLISHHATLVSNMRRRFTAGMQTALPEPLAPFAMGLLIGQRATLPADTKQDLLMVGLTHIIAVSGYNLTIMLQASRKLLARRSKRLSTLLSLILIGVFLLFAGASASIVRAAIVSVLTIATSYYGRSFKPLTLIALAAAITAWASPFYVWTDTSWYLSFLAFFGVMVLAPLLIGRFVRQRWRESLVIMVAMESICAEIMTMPFVLHTFGQLSFIGLPANVLVVTLVPLAMLLSLVAGLGGMLAVSFSGWLAWPARLLLTYMLDVAHLLSRVPHIFVQQLGLGLVQMIWLYALVAALVALLHFKRRSESATITDKIRRVSIAVGKGKANERSLEVVND